MYVYGVWAVLVCGMLRILITRNNLQFGLLSGLDMHRQTNACLHLHACIHMSVHQGNPQESLESHYNNYNRSLLLFSLM